MTPTTLILDQESQPWADTLIDALETQEHIAEHSALNQLTAWLDQDGRMFDCVCEKANWIHSVSLAEVIERVWDRGETDDSVESIVSAVKSTVNEALTGTEFYWGDEYIVPIAATLTHSDGRSGILGLQIDPYLSGPYEWHGVFRDLASYQRWIAPDDMFTSEDFEKIDTPTMLALWRQQD